MKTSSWTDQYWQRVMPSSGGKVIIMSEKTIESTPKTIIDVSGQYKGGQIRALAKKTNKISGNLVANSNQIGGNIDITAEKGGFSLS